MNKQPAATLLGHSAPSSRGMVDAEPIVVSLVPGIEGIDSRDWALLFAGHPDDHALVAHVAASGFDGVTLSTIQARRGTELLLVLPVFQARFNIASMVQGRLSPAAKAVGRWMPWPLNPKLLGVGFVEGEWGAAGLSPSLERVEIDALWRAAIARFDELARASGTGLMCLLELDAKTLTSIGPEILSRFARVDTTPCAQLPLPFKHIDEYLATLSRSMRSKMRRRLRDAAALRIERTDKPGPHLDRMYELYLQTVARSELKLGIQRREFFERLCERVPGAHFTLYFEEEHLIAFNALIERPHVLVDKYFCMELEVGRRWSLYAVSWMKNVQYAIDRRIPLYHAGPGAEGAKSHFRCATVPTDTLFRHRNPLIHAVLAFAARKIGRRSEAQARAREEASSDAEAPV